MTTATSSPDLAAGRAARRRRTEPVHVLSAAVGAASVAMAYLVGRDGSAGWQVVRVGAVVAVAIAALLALRRARHSRWLVTAGTVPDETDAARYIRQGAPVSVQIWNVPDAGHTRALATHPAEWNRRVTAFLDQAVGS